MSNFTRSHSSTLSLISLAVYAVTIVAGGVLYNLGTTDDFYLGVMIVSVAAVLFVSSMGFVYKIARKARNKVAVVVLTILLAAACALAGLFAAYIFALIIFAIRYMFFFDGLYGKI